LNKRSVCWETGEVGPASLIMAEERLLILTDKGELIEAPASPESFRVSCRAQILKSETRAFPALAHGYFYARGKDQLVCLDLTGKKNKTD
jgi:outer membrane protein assembly factor BamB